MSRLPLRIRLRLFRSRLRLRSHRIRRSHRWHVDHPWRITAEILGALIGAALCVLGLTWAFSGFGPNLDFQGHNDTVLVKFESIYGKVSQNAVPIGNGPGHQVAPPVRQMKIGWWGVPPGSAQGTTLLTWRGSHLHFPSGALSNLEDLDIGATLYVNTLPYRVDSVETQLDDTLEAQVTDLLPTNGPPRVVMVAFEGWDDDSGTYGRNIVVVAVPDFTPPITETPYPDNSGG